MNNVRHAAPNLLVPGTVRLNGRMNKSGSRGGRPTKGDRDAFKVRPARAVGDLVRERAEAAGMTYGDFISAILSREVGLPDLAPQPPHATDEELPITDVT